MKAVIDTNVLLVANGQHPDASDDCVAECVKRLQAMQQSGITGRFQELSATRLLN
ncbi:hypothetical protein [Stutzerimonas balearica]|uniref:hypothetical protein n=1 Tax=Stutzerimonas balearica TaxID=74829 RepID=UPI0028AEA4F9|nr:hypothetical protein [Stutzerimonas balearica]